MDMRVPQLYYVLKVFTGALPNSIENLLGIGRVISAFFHMKVGILIESVPKFQTPRSISPSGYLNSKQWTRLLPLTIHSCWHNQIKQHPRSKKQYSRWQELLWININNSWQYTPLLTRRPGIILKLNNVPTYHNKERPPLPWEPQSCGLLKDTQQGICHMIMVSFHSFFTRKPGVIRSLANGNVQLPRNYRH